jgi:hypothetical protein
MRKLHLISDLVKRLLPVSLCVFSMKNMSTQKQNRSNIAATYLLRARWLQLPLYIGLHSGAGVSSILGPSFNISFLSAFGNEAALQHILQAIAVEGARPRPS